MISVRGVGRRQKSAVFHGPNLKVRLCTNFTLYHGHVRHVSSLEYKYPLLLYIYFFFSVRKNF